MRGPTYRQLPDYDRHDFQYLGVSSIWDVAIIIDEYSVKKRGYDVGADHFKIISLVNVCLNKLEDFFLDGAKSSNFWRLGRNVSCALLILH
jgi:hypothetical protein